MFINDIFGDKDKKLDEVSNELIKKIKPKRANEDAIDDRFAAQYNTPQALAKSQTLDKLAASGTQADYDRLGVMSPQQIERDYQAMRAKEPEQDAAVYRNPALTPGARTQTFKTNPKGVPLREKDKESNKSQDQTTGQSSNQKSQLRKDVDAVDYNKQQQPPAAPSAEQKAGIRQAVSDYNKDKKVDEAGPFSYGAKKPRKGSVADLAAQKRKEQEHGKQPAEPRDQRVGVARVVKDVAEGISVVDQDYDLDQMHLTLDIEGKKVSFTYWDYEEDFSNAERRDVFDQLQEQPWYKGLDHPTKMEILDAAYRAIRGLEPQEYRPTVRDEPLDEQGVAEGGFDIPEIPRAPQPRPEPKNKAVGEGSVQDKLHRRHQELRKKSGLPDPNYYKELKATYDLPDEERYAKAAELKKKYQVKEARRAEANFDVEDLKRLEQIRDLPTLKAQAMALISKPSERPMKPEKVAWFDAALDRMDSRMAIIKLMYDLLLSGEGHQVIGSKRSMNPNSYRSRFGESSDGSVKYEITLADGKKDYTTVRPAQAGDKAPIDTRSAATMYQLNNPLKKVKSVKVVDKPKEEKTQATNEDIESYVEELERAGYDIVNERRMTCPECGGAAYADEMLAEKQDACYHKVKSRYKVWPSAYASGALVRCRKKGAKNWGNKSKK